MIQNRHKKANKFALSFSTGEVQNGGASVVDKNIPKVNVPANIT